MLTIAFPRVAGDVASKANVTTVEMTALGAVYVVFLIRLQIRWMYERLVLRSGLAGSAVSRILTYPERILRQKCQNDVLT